MDQLMKILQELREDVDFSAEDKLVDNGILDSFDIVTLVGELNDAFGISLGAADLEPENFNSVAAIWAMVQRYGE